MNLKKRQQRAKKKAKAATKAKVASSRKSARMQKHISQLLAMQAAGIQPPQQPKFEN